MGARRRKGRRRGRLEIAQDILRIARHGEMKTYIMYRANLSHSVLDRYLMSLVRAGLLQAVGEGKRGALYKTTQKGKHFLSGFKEIERLLDGES